MEAFDQPRLFRLAVNDLFVQASYVIGEGWRLSLGARRQDESWSEAEHDRYMQLQPDELLDVIAAALERLLTPP